MTQQAQQVRTRLLSVIIAGLAGAGFVTAAPAAGLGAGAHANVGAGAQVAAPDDAQAGGSAEAHMSPVGSINSNAQWQGGAVRGSDRAAGRMNPKGAEMRQPADEDPEAAGRAIPQGKY
jgi:hypothetical protein